MFSIYNIAFLIGRVIVGGFFLMNGFNHFAQFNMMTGYAKSKGVPAADDRGHPEAVADESPLLILAHPQTTREHLGATSSSLHKR